MKEKIKKILSIILCSLMVLSTLPILGFAGTENYGSFYGYFYDNANGNENTPLKGVNVILKDSSGNKIDSVTTNDEGYFIFQNVACNTYDEDDDIYYDSFYIDVDSKYTINDTDTTDNGIRVSIIANMSNTYLKGGNYKYLTKKTANISFTKTDSETNQPVENAVYALVNYGDNVENAITEYSNQTNGYFTTNENGKIIISDVLLGHYELVEISAEGYFVNEDKVEFTLSNDGETVEIGQTDDKRCSVTLNKTDKSDASVMPNVDFNLYKEKNAGVVSDNDRLINSYTTDKNGQIKISDLTSGSYYFKETETQEDYILDETPIQFVLNSTNSDIILNITNSKQPLNNVTINKYALNTTNYINGAVLNIINNAGKCIATKTTDGSPWIIALRAGTYTLVEEESPKGYLPANDINFTVKDNPVNADDNIVTMYDSPITAIFYKNDTNDNMVSGADLKLTNDNDDSIIYEWTSSNTGYTITGIPAGTYTFEETKAPAGYIKAEPKTITIENTSKPQEFTMSNDYTKVQFSKQSITNTNEIPGAQLSIYKTTDMNTAIYSWTSGTTPHEIDKLSMGDYILVEKTAPIGYAIAESINFTVEETGNIQTVIMKDTPITVELYKINETTEKLIDGASLSLTNIDDPTIEYTWTSSSKNGYTITNIPAGTYTFKEIAAPSGYIIAEPQTIEIKAIENKQEFTMADKQTEIQIEKRNTESKDYLDNATLAIYEESSFDKTGDLIANASPVYSINKTESKTYTVYGLAIGNYRLVELTSPDGYLVANNIEFSITQADNGLITMYDSPITATFYKNDINNKELLAGANLKLTSVSNPNISYEWTSTNTGYTISGIPAGKYIFEETTAPEGYLLAEPKTIEIESTSKPQEFTMFDDYTKVQISKQDIANKDNKEAKELEGATLSLYSANDKNTPIETWVSGNKPHEIDMLPTGEYILVEAKAPNGYSLTEAVTFTVKATGEIQKVTMYDEAITSVKTEKDQTIDSSSTNIKTGLQNPLVYIILSSIGICGIIAIIIYNKKNKKTNK